MLVGTVAGIDNRHFRHLRGIACRAFQIMAHDDEVNIVAHHLDGVLQGLPFRRGRCGRVGEAYYTASKAIDRRFKTKPRAGGGFKKERRHHLPVKELVIGMLFKITCGLKQL